MFEVVLEKGKVLLVDHVMRVEVELAGDVELLFRRAMDQVDFLDPFDMRCVESSIELDILDVDFLLFCPFLVHHLQNENVVVTSNNPVTGYRLAPDAGVLLGSLGWLFAFVVVLLDEFLDCFVWRDTLLGA